MNARRLATAAVCALCLGTGLGLARLAADQSAQGKPTLVMRADPLMSFTPAKVRFFVELRGGADDYEDFYCPTIEWVWDDDTRSETTSDCDPYKAGESQIRRRYSAEHLYRAPNSYRPEFRIKRKDKVIAAVAISIEVQPGLRP
jgi:hypothetical protein